MELIMLVGIPGSGKSTLAAEYGRRGYRVHSSDAIRGELYGSEEEQGRAAEVFDILHERVREDIRSGRSCVLDASNLSRKRRMNALRGLKGRVDRRTCVLALASPRTCQERNLHRERTVPPERIEDMLRAFETPYYYEGWDAIEFAYSGEPWAFPREEAAAFSQDNPHHTLTLGAHLDAARAYCEERGCPAAVSEAAWYHDIGKLYTKRFFNRRGEPTKTAHFYGHENYGAYLYLCEKAASALREGAWPEALYIANLINWHMRPLNVWRDSPAGEERDRKLMGERMYEALAQLHRADLAAH